RIAWTYDAPDVNLNAERHTSAWKNEAEETGMVGPDTMNAAYVERRGAAASIQYGRIAMPRCGPTDVLVQIEAVAVNAVDTFVRSGAFRTAMPFPFVVGRDLVGRVVASGSGVVGFGTGDVVWTNSLGHGGRQVAAAEFA